MALMYIFFNRLCGIFFKNICSRQKISDTIHTSFFIFLTAKDFLFGVRPKNLSGSVLWRKAANMSGTMARRTKTPAERVYSLSVLVAGDGNAAEAPLGDDFDLDGLRGTAAAAFQTKADGGLMTLHLGFPSPRQASPLAFTSMMSASINLAPAALADARSAPGFVRPGAPTLRPRPSGR